MSEQIETLSKERVYDILIGEKVNDKICEKVPHGVERSASFLIDISKLNCQDDLKSNDGEAMSHHGQALRQISADENKEIAVQRKCTEDDHEDGCSYLYEYVSKTKCKKCCRHICTLYSDMGKTDLHRYALVHFQIDINYKYTPTSHGNCKKSRKSYLKTMSSTIESLKILASSKKPKSAYIDTMGKVRKTTSPSELTKNYNQANYARNLVKNKFESVSDTGDDLLQAVCKCEKSGQKFVQEVQSTPEGIVAISSRCCTILCPATKGGCRSVFCRSDFQTGGFLRNSGII